jgi:hypothetical protein
MKKGLRYLLVSTFTCAILLCSLFQVGCSDSEYKTFALKEGIQGITFEYPVTYRLTRLDLQNDNASQYTTLGLTSNQNGAYADLFVYIWKTSSDMDTANKVMNTLLGNASGVLENYKIGQRTSIQIDDSNGQMAYFSANSQVGDNSTAPSITRPATYRVSCYIHNNLIIEIDMTSDDSIADVTSPQYDHILQTVKTLN